MLILLDQERFFFLVEACFTEEATNNVKVYQFKPKDSEIKPYSLCLGKISKKFIVDMKNKG